MRASFKADLVISESYSITGDAHHHLVHVIRLEVGEELLLLNGKGLKVFTKVEAISKKEVRLSFVSSDLMKESYSIDLAIGMPKKEALELSLKQAVELGARKIYLIRSQYSQQRYLEADRVESLLVSALEQSNSPFLPEIIETKWEEITWDDYNMSLMMDSQSKDVPTFKGDNLAGSILLIVGPEGGFSPEEIHYLHQRPKMNILSLPTPILRTPTAVATGFGVILQSLSKGQKG